MTYWFYLSMILPALCIFALTPKASPSLRNGRLILAVLLCFLCLNLDTRTKVEHMAFTYQQCLKAHPVSSSLPAPPPQCGNPPEISLPIAFITLLGWIPSVGLAGILELLWRSSYYKTIRSITNYEGRRMSTIFIVLGVIAFPFSRFFFL